MITNSPVRLYVDSSRDSFPFYPHQFKSQRLACEDSTGQIKVLDSALFWSGLWSLKHITWQASSITVSYLAVLSTGGVKTWWNRPQIQVLETSGRSFSERKTEPAIYRTPQTHRQKGEIPNGRTRIPRWDVRWSALYEIVVMEPERGAARLLRPTTQIKPSSRPPNCRHGDSKPDRYHHDPSMSYINKYLIRFCHTLMHYMCRTEIQTKTSTFILCKFCLTLVWKKTIYGSKNSNQVVKIQCWLQNPNTYEQNATLCLFRFSFVLFSSALLSLGTKTTWLVLKYLVWSQMEMVGLPLKNTQFWRSSNSQKCLNMSWKYPAVRL